VPGLAPWQRVLGYWQAVDPRLPSQVRYGALRPAYRQLLMQALNEASAARLQGMGVGPDEGLDSPELRAVDVALKRVAVVGAVRERWPELRLGLHLHDTRGTAMANALMGLQMGIDTFDSACAGLGGCPFAGHTGAAGNICTEDLAFMCEEMGIETGVDLDALIACARMAEEIVGHPLPGKLMRAGTLQRFRR